MNTPPEPCMPFTPCWCELHPGNPNCVKAVPINDTHFSISIVISILIYLLIKKI